MLRRSSRAAWAIVLLIVIIAASSVSFSSKNIQLAQFVILITLLLPREQRRVAAPAHVTAAQSAADRSSGIDSGSDSMTIYVDHTHLGRHVTGLERITLELFPPEALAPLDVVPVTAQGTRQMVTTQTLGLPMRLAASSSILLCPGFPPSPLLRPFASRVLPYIHDDFPDVRGRPTSTRRARLYMAAPFKLALRHYPRFLANSSDTRRKLAAHCRPDAEITLYRPPVRNVFGLDPEARAEREAPSRCGWWRLEPWSHERISSRRRG